MALVRSLPLLALAVASSASAQVTLHTFAGATAGGEHSFGAAIGDVDGDGVPDFAIGAPSSVAGTVSLYSGATLGLTATLVGEGNGDAFGLRIAPAGNVTGSGLPTLIIGAPGHDGPAGSDAGRAYLYEFQDPSWVLIHVIDGEGAGDELGESVAAAGDVDGDGRGDVIVGAPLWGGGNRGRAYVWGDSQAGGWARIGSVLAGANPGDEFGMSVSGAGLVDGDALTDVIIGAPEQAASAGAAYVYAFSGGTWTQVWVLQDDPASIFGYWVGAGDLDGDGSPELLVGAPEDDDGGPDAGSIIVFSAATGNQVLEVTGSTALGHYLGISADIMDDLDGDGIRDLLIGVAEAKPSDTGAARIVSGATGATLFTLSGDAIDDGMGETVAVIGDVTGDGRQEVLVGAPQCSPKLGYARLYTGWGQIGTSYCGPAVMNSSGLSGEIHAIGSAVVADNDMSLAAVQLPVGQFGFFLNSMLPGFVTNPGGSQGNLCLSGGIGRYNAVIKNTGSGGVLTLALDLTQTPTPTGPVAIQPGQTWYFQCWFRDKNPAATSNFTDAVAVTFF